jgi:hypothetical protein
MKVYHGTAWKLAEKIKQEETLKPRKGNRYVYVTTDPERAKMYAEAWTAAYITDIAPLLNIENPAPEGAILTMEIDEEFIEKDPYNSEGEPDQYRVKGNIYTDDMTFEKVLFPKLKNESALARAYCFWIGIARATDESIKITDYPMLFEKKKKTKFKSFKDFSNGETESYAPPEYVVQPADGDKGFALVKSAFKKLKKIYQPNISK